MRYLKLIYCVLTIFLFSPGAHANYQADIFKLSIVSNKDNILLQWNIKPGYYLYKKRIIVKGITNINYPPALLHQDKLGQWQEIYRNQLQLTIPFREDITVSYQGCSDKAICLPPQTVSKHLSSHAFIWTILSFFGLGVLLAFTPCVLPMLPVMTKVVLGNQTHSKQQIWGLAAAYVVGMAGSYAAVGATLSVVGKNLFMLMQNPLVTIGMAIIYGYFGLATLEWVKIKLPQSWQQKTIHYRANLQSGRYSSAAIIGSLSLLVLSPCVTAPLLGALAYITQLGELWKGTLALCMLGLGMGTPLMIFAVSAGHLLPKAGVWMNQVKSLLAILLFSVAALLIQRTFASIYAYCAWVVVLLIAAWLIKPAKNYLLRVTLIMVLITESTLLTYAIILSKQLPWPFHFTPTTQTVISKHHLEKIIAQTHKPVILYFTAKWCATCQYLDKHVWVSEKLVNLYKKNRFIKIDISDSQEQILSIMRQYGVIAPPTVIKIIPNNAELRLSGDEITLQRLTKWIE